jgi:hypothetical protein
MKLPSLGWGKIVSCVVLGLGVGLAACGTPFPERYRGGPERIALAQTPYPEFIYDEEKAARCLLKDFFLHTDETLTKPVLMLKDFAQNEWAANEMKGVYRAISPGQLVQVLEARDDIRTIMGVPLEASTTASIQVYADRANNLQTADTLLMIDRREDLKKAMIKAGYVYKWYTDYDPGSRSSPFLIVDGKVVTDPRLWRFC